MKECRCVKLSVERLLDLEQVIEERLGVFSFKINQPSIVVLCEYQHRLNNLRSAYPQESKSHLSKFMVKAYQGALMYFERQIE